MEWGKLYANLPDDPRVQAAEADAPGAGWLLVESMCYCTRAERSGYIPRTQVERFGNGPRFKARVAVLLREGLWLPIDGGYELNPDVWTEERNLSDSAEKKKAADRARIAARRAAEKAAAAATADGDADGDGDAEVSRDMSRDSRATDHATGSGDSRTLDQSREDKTTTSDDLVGHRPVADAPGDDDDDEGIARIAAVLSRRAGRAVTAGEARRVAGSILAKAEKAGTRVGNRVAYVTASVAEETDVHALLLGPAALPADLPAGNGHSLPDWCGDPTCNPRTRMREKPDGTPYRCPDCGPEARTA